MILLQTSAGKASESRDTENASVQDDRDTDTKKPEEEEIEYASITIHHPATEAKWENISYSVLTLNHCYLQL